MEDHDVPLLRPIGDLSEGEVFDSLNFCWYFCG